MHIADFLKVNFGQPLGDIGLLNQGKNASIEPASTVVVEKGSDNCAEETQLEPELQIDEASEGSLDQGVDLSELTFYNLFIVKVKVLCAKHPCTAEELVEGFAVNKTQINTWLKQAVEEGELEKLNRPVRYQLNTSKQFKLALE